MDQFHELKDANPGTILFFRMGDFYELFHEDAEVGSNVLGLALTSRDKNAEKPIPMAGFPWHQLEENLRLMLRSGHKVTVAEPWTIGRLTAAMRAPDGTLRAAATPRLMQAYAVGR